MIKKYKIIKEVMENIGLLDEAKIKKALAEQSKSGGRFSRILVDLGYVSNQEVGKTLIPQIGMLPLAIKLQDIEDNARKALPSNIALLHRLCPVKYESDTLVLATDDPLNFLAAENLEKILSTPLKLELIYSAGLDALLKSIYAAEKKSDVDLEKMSKDIKNIKGGEDAPIIKLVNAVIAEAMKRRASDIHVEPLESKFRIRYRIDGVLHEVPGPPKRLEGSVISRIKIMSGMDIAEKRLPQDGRIKIDIDKKNIDLRVSSLPGIHGESIVMRILDKTSFLVGLENLGFLPDQRKPFEKIINLPNGMVLVTGPTGSGKTTTLYATLSHVNQKDRKVITIEDPVEYQLDGINQVQVKPQIGLTFAGGLRSMLRQAPDIIMVGEIRDLETAEISIQSALTGHLIFSTLHTNDASSAVTRLVDMGIKTYLVSSTVQGVLAQRLVRTICPACREAYKPSKEEAEFLMLKPEEEKQIELYRGKGCSACSDTGFKGRMGIFELLVIDDEIRELILNNASSSEISLKAKSSGMRSLKEDGIEKVKRGYTSIGEVLRVTQDT